MKIPTKNIYVTHLTHKMQPCLEREQVRKVSYVREGNVKRSLRSGQFLNPSTVDDEVRLEKIQGCFYTAYQKESIFEFQFFL